ncbi:MAG: carboxypeptidase regulatory-like domain-containing protein [Planctomycetota bacterium]|nr:carboxypeptidase regulatory-like domain-containing protein [Planctomycetota bacterium]
MTSRSLRGAVRAPVLVVLAALVLVVAALLWWRMGLESTGQGAEAVAPTAAEPGASEALTPLENDTAAARLDTTAPKISGDGFTVEPRVRLSGPGKLSGRVLDRASGAGVEGASVELLPLPPAGQEFFGRVLRLAKTSEAFASRTQPIAVAASGADGSFEFVGIRTGTYYLQARGAWSVPDTVARARVAASGEGGPVDLYVRSGGRVIGRVVQPDGKPIAGADVMLTLGPGNVIENLRAGDMVFAKARTDEFGGFLLAGLPPGAGYDLTASGAGFALSHTLDVEVLAGEDTLATIQAKTGGGVRGRVVTRVGVESEGAPPRALAGAHVALVPRGLRDLQFAEELLLATHATTDANGAFLIEHVPTGEFDLVGVADLHVPAKGPRVLVAEGMVAPAEDFVLPTGPRVSGRVLDSAGAPLEGVTVRWNSVDFRNFDFDFSFAPLLASAVKGFDFPKSDVDGRFTAGAFAGEAPYRIEFFKSGFEDTTHRWDPAKEPDGFEVRMERGGALEGIVVDAARKKPVTSFTIETNDRVETQADAPGNRNPFSGGLLVEHPQGKFRVDPVKSGEKVRLTFRAPGYRETTLDALEVKEGETKRGVIVELQPGGTVRGTVANRDGKPIAGAQVFALASASANRFEPAGRRRFGDGPPELEQLPPGFRDFAAQLGLLGDRAVVSRADGSFELTGLEPGSTVVLATHREYSIGRSEPVQVTVETPAEVELELSTGGGVQGTARDRFARPVTGAIVLALSPANVAGEGRASGGGIYQSRTDSEGRYRITRMVGGSYFVVLTRGDEALNPMSFLGTLNFDVVTVPDDEIVDYDIVDSSSGATRVFGTVTDEGRPVGRGNITALSFESAGMLGVDLKIAQVQGEGRYEFAGLAPGEYQFNIDSPGDGRPPVRIVAEIPDQPEFRLDLRYPIGGVEGRVLGGNERTPLAGVEVTLRLADPFESSGWLGRALASEAGVRRERTNDDGEFRFGSLGAGRYTLSVRAPRASEDGPRYAGAAAFEVEVREDRFSGGVEIVLPAAVELVGRTVDTTGKPVGGAQVFARLAGVENAVPERASSGDDGEFRFASLGAGRYDLSVTADGFADAERKDVEVGAANAKPVELQLAQGIDVRVKVLGSNGQPVAGATGRLVPKGRAAAVDERDVGRAFNNLFNGKGVSDSKGMLGLGSFGAGEYVLEVQRGTEKASEDVTLGGSAPVELRVRLR